MGALRLALIVVVVGVLTANYVENETLGTVVIESLSIVASPFVQLGFATGIIQRYAFATYDSSGIKYVPSMTSKEHFNRFRKYRLPSKSAVAVTFPKSGTHLLLQLLLQIQSKGELDFENIHHQHCFIEIERHNVVPPGCEAEPIKTLDNIHTADTEYKVFGTHLPVLHCPHSDVAKYVVMMRDPLDTLLSTYNMLSSMLGRHLSPGTEVYADLLFYSEHDPGSWAPFYKQWWLEKNRSNVLFLFYEDVIANKTDAIMQIAQFFDIKLDEAAIGRIEYRSSFQYMKENQIRFDPPVCSSIGIGKRGMPMVNKGKVGRGKKALPKSVKERILRTYYAVFGGTTFPLHRYAASFE